MDTLVSSWILVCGCLTVLAVAVAAVLRKRGPSRSVQRAPRETPTVALVRRRRELMAQLRELAGDGGTDLVQAEARRRRSTTSDIQVLEAAVERAERESQKADLQTRR